MVIECLKKYIKCNSIKSNSNWSCDLKMVTMRPTLSGSGIKWLFLGQVGPIGGHKRVLVGAHRKEKKMKCFFFYCLILVSKNWLNYLTILMSWKNIHGQLNTKSIFSRYSCATMTF